MNDQVESANKILLRGLKRKLEKVKGTWSEEVPRILWVYHTTPQSITKETPFSFVYGSDAMIPVEIQENTPRFQSFVVEESNEGRKVNLDLLDNVREHARINSGFEEKGEAKAKEQDETSVVQGCRLSDAKGPSLPVRNQVISEVD